MGAVTVGFGLSTVFKALTPTADFVNLEPIDFSGLEPGQGFTVLVRGKPLFIRHLLPSEFEEERSRDLLSLLDNDARNRNVPAGKLASVENRVFGSYFIGWGICPRLGCVPLSDSGDFGGWFCPCSAAHFDKVGRIHKGPFSRNLAIPRYVVLSDTSISVPRDDQAWLSPT